MGSFLKANCVILGAVPTLSVGFEFFRGIGSSQMDFLFHLL